MKLNVEQHQLFSVIENYAKPSRAKNNKKCVFYYEHNIDDRHYEICLKITINNERTNTVYFISIN